MWDALGWALVGAGVLAFAVDLLRVTRARAEEIPLRAIPEATAREEAMRLPDHVGFAGLVLVFVGLMVTGLPFERAFGVALIASGTVQVSSVFGAAHQASDLFSTPDQESGAASPFRSAWTGLGTVGTLVFGCAEAAVGVALLFFPV